MDNAIKVLKQFDNIYSVGGTKAKGKWVENIKANPETEAICREMLRYCYDGNLVFGYIAPACTDMGNAGDYDTVNADVWGQMKYMLEHAATNQMPNGLARRQMFEQFLNSLPQRIRFWFTRIINKDLGVGIAEKGWFKHFPKLYFKFLVGLCDKMENQTWDGLRWVEPKWDGYRCIAIKRNGVVETLSREGKPLFNTERVKAVLQAVPKDNFVLDGECIGNNFSETQSILSTETPHPLANTITYRCFDTMSLKDWDAQECKQTLRVRRANLEAFFGEFFHGLNDKTNTVFLGEYFPVIGSDAARALCLELAKKKWEGGVIKDPEGLYEFGKRFWLKWKPVFTEELLIVGANQGEADGKYAETLGSLQIEGDIVYRGKTIHVIGNASGMSDEEREKLWKMHKAGTLVGKVGEFEFQEITRNSKTGVYSVRFPQFQHLRTDKSA